jgi:hypothetical protein
MWPEGERDANEELGYWLRSYQETHPEGRALDLTLPEQNLRTAGQNRRRPSTATWASRSTGSSTGSGGR